MRKNTCYRGLLLLALLTFGLQPWAQSYVHERSKTYQWPTDPLVVKHLKEWQDLKFGIILHWGLYSVPGIVESWQLTSEDWITPDPKLSYQEFKDWYWGLIHKFNPTQFNPEQWAEVAHDAGMKYMVFTTKHHDGFCLFDSKQTDFTINHSAFAENPHSDVARYVFDAFRQKGMMTGCYFSKPDWHSQDYWWNKRATPNRLHNYEIAKYPERWNRYKSFVYNQVDELMSNYGRFDILWLDGGWCTPPREDINLDSIVDNARSHQPGLIVVDRACPGKHENYQTPEQRIPDHQLRNPWESCMTLTNDWGWTDHPVFKSTAKVIATLAEVVAKGGSLLLGVGPTPEGIIEEGAVSRLHQVGEWLRGNGEAVYSTVPTAVYSNALISSAKSDRVWFTANKADTTLLYAIIPRPDSTLMPREVSWIGNRPVKGAKMRILSTGKVVTWHTDKEGVTHVTLPSDLQNTDGVALSFYAQQIPLYKEPLAGVEDRVNDLLSRMTFEEKVAQVSCPLGWPYWQRNGSGFLLSASLIQKAKEAGCPGCLWAVQRADPWTQKTLTTGLSPEEAAVVMNMLQHFAVDSTRLGIPMFFAEEAAHGHMAIGKTVFPTGLCQASTFDEALLQKMGAAIAKEVRLTGSHIAYGPVLDLARDPRWSRVEETFGEDPYLTGALGAAVVKGLQGQTISTLKHFAAYGVPTGGLNGEGVSMGMNTLRQEYLYPFEQAIKAGAQSIMASYNAIDGVPCSASSYLLHDVLREEWGFRGMVFSDLHSIEGVATSQHVARDIPEAAGMALAAGVDVDLEGNAYRRLPLLYTGLSSSSQQLTPTTQSSLMAALDSAVSHVLRLKFQMRLFEQPYVNPSAVKGRIRNAEHRELARQVAREGVVLLKNDGILPLSKSTKRIAVIGPNADNIYNQLGDYTAPQDSKDIVTVLNGIRQAVPAAEVTYVKGCAIRDTTQTDIASAVAAARQADVTILVLGGSSARDFRTNYLDTGAASVSSSKSKPSLVSSPEGSSSSKSKPSLVSNMNDSSRPKPSLFSDMNDSSKSKPSLVSDMECGEGYDRASLSLMGDQHRLMQALINAGVPLVVVYMEGRPLGMTLPAERSNALLTVWYPGEQGGAALADILFGDVSPSGRLPISVPRGVGQLPVFYSHRPSHDYIDMQASPLYPFGYGLTYSHFTYSDIHFDEATHTVSCMLTNDGQREATEVVQCYKQQYSRSSQQPDFQLVAFQRVNLKPNEVRRISFAVSLGVEATYFIGASSADLHLKTKVSHQ